MRKVLGLLAIFVFTLLLASPALAAPGKGKNFVHGIVITVDGTDYYPVGPPDGSGGERDIPGHYWAMAGPNHLLGRHYNTGPFGTPSWWSSDAGNGELLYLVDARIDTWSPEKAGWYAKRGYIHYHELVLTTYVGGLPPPPSELHPTKVVWLKHTARTSFTLDGGPHPELAHNVTQGIDYMFIPIYDMPYP